MLFIPVIAAWLVNQLVKVMVATLDGELSFAAFWKHGGMPSSHSALVTAAATSIFLDQGATAAFLVSLVVALIVMRDAVNRATGSHSAAEVFVGALTGLLVPLALH